MQSLCRCSSPFFADIAECDEFHGFRTSSRRARKSWDKYVSERTQWKITVVVLLLQMWKLNMTIWSHYIQYHLCLCRKLERIAVIVKTFQNVPTDDPVQNNWVACFMLWDFRYIGLTDHTIVITCYGVNNNLYAQDFERRKCSIQRNGLLKLV